MINYVITAAVTAIVTAIVAWAIAGSASRAAGGNKTAEKNKENIHADDSAENERLELLLAQNEKIRREFTANVSHELKTPLQSISGYAELLKNGVVAPDKVSEFSGRIYTEAQRMITLVEDVLELSHLDEGIQSVQKERVDLYSESVKIAETLKDEAEAAGVAMNINGETAFAEGYRQFISLIIYNLCENSIKYNVPGGRVDVSVRNEGDSVVLTVSDTGVGIPEDQQERVFERFYRVDKSRSKEVGGTGLGLSIVKHAAQSNNAEISLDSRQGEGTTVTVRFMKAKDV